MAAAKAFGFTVNSAQRYWGTSSSCKIKIDGLDLARVKTVKIVSFRFLNHINNFPGGFFNWSTGNGANLYYHQMPAGRYTLSDVTNWLNYTNPADYPSKYNWQVFGNKMRLYGVAGQTTAHLGTGSTYPSMIGFDPVNTSATTFVTSSFAPYSPDYPKALYCKIPEFGIWHHGKVYDAEGTFKVPLTDPLVSNSYEPISVLFNNERKIEYSFSNLPTFNELTFQFYRDTGVSFSFDEAEWELELFVTRV